PKPVCLRPATKQEEGLHCRSPLANGIHDVEELLFQEKHCRSGIIQEVGELMRRKPDVQRKQYCARFRDAIVGLQQAMAIHAQEGDAVAGLDAGLAQSARKTANTLGKLRICKPLVSAHDCGFARVLLLCIAQKAYGCKWDVHGLSRSEERRV